ncbi:peroxin 20 [Histoplasma capsulatum H143]|uniref:Peroxin 20 n=1 Tax=Ajellomyces capsulatus (strain H143) TaxID=544712 RepID=C6H7T1_AJECH|nr:peroxin 20 [Histoplasma capsulatum H143]
MADALCGPSNALQSFQKHTSVDRSLQQDRIFSRHSPAQGFRSQNHNEGILDRDFNAFEAGVSGAPLSDIQHPASVLGPEPQHLAFNHTENSGWASAFQNLQISGPAQHVPPQQFRAESSSGSWQNEIMQNTFQTPQTEAAQIQIPQAPFRYGPALGGVGFGVMNDYPVHQDESQSHFQRHDEAAIFDESAFETAFAEVRAEVELQERQLQNGKVIERTEAEQTVRIGADTIQPQVDGSNESDELARTAGQLLDSVSHDQSQKFKESNFLALMRQLRDREVTVDGDEFRQALHPGGQYYPEQKRPQQIDAEGAATTPPHSTKNVTGDGIGPSTYFEQPTSLYPKSRVPYDTPDAHWSV